MNKDINTSKKYIDTFKELSIDRKKEEIINMLSNMSSDYKTVCNAFLGTEKGIIEEDNIDFNNENDFLNNVFSHIVELDYQVGLIVDTIIKSK